VQRWVTFDCYGTLIDWDAGLAAELGRLWPGEDIEDLLSDYHRVEPLIQQDGALSYRAVLSRSVRAIAGMRELSVPPGGNSWLADSVPRWPPFPEVPAALEELRLAGLKLAILSNTDPDYLDASIAQLGVAIDEVVVASTIGSYKPRHRHWEEFQRITGVRSGQHIHVAASLFHDIEPCAELSIPAVWINRLAERSEVPRAAELGDLGGLPAALERLW
jgi:2-haloacid dehalogenase